MPNAHAKFSPSAAHRWVRCPASIKLSELAYKIKPELLDQTTPAAEEGTFAHEVVEKCLLSKKSIDELFGKLVPPDFQTLQGFVDWVRKQSGILYVEQKVNIYPPHCWGTADVIIVGHTLVVADLKFGRIPVSARGNLQLLAYAYGAMRRFAPDAESFLLAIYQPRRKTGGPPLDVWRTDRKTVLGAYELLRKAVNAANSSKPDIVAGPHCEYCPARKVSCPLSR